MMYMPDDATEDEVADMADWQWCRNFEARHPSEEEK